ncbi:hypothetical protein ACODM8_04580 [Vibrio ostreicida]|uniref:Uncharacterized protein n=1 Tax=Vibrio ostreicida TaxID=526588 RepID=A0ABT8BWW0_9VIBR|nr:hypothetical protein [Vibrio ostreicida]MDN3611478.1 hypothetical protein [Vibrio ostreicida]
MIREMTQTDLEQFSPTFADAIQVSRKREKKTKKTRTGAFILFIG